MEVEPAVEVGAEVAAPGEVASETPELALAGPPSSVSGASGLTEVLVSMPDKCCKDSSKTHKACARCLLSATTGRAACRDGPAPSCSCGGRVGPGSRHHDHDHDAPQKPLLLPRSLPIVGNCALTVLATLTAFFAASVLSAQQHPRGVLPAGFPQPVGTGRARAARCCCAGGAESCWLHLFHVYLPR